MKLCCTQTTHSVHAKRGQRPQTHAHDIYMYVYQYNIHQLFTKGKTILGTIVNAYKKMMVADLKSSDRKIDHKG